MTSFDQQVRERAYEIWAASGCEDGLADLHWLSAEQALLGEAAPTRKVERKADKSRSADKLPSSAKVARETAGSAAPATTAAKPRASKGATVTARKRSKSAADLHA